MISFSSSLVAPLLFDVSVVSESDVFGLALYRSLLVNKRMKCDEVSRGLE